MKQPPLNLQSGPPDSIKLIPVILISIRNALLSGNRFLNLCFAFIIPAFGAHAMA